jgi:hypothetical protein
MGQLEKLCQQKAEIVFSRHCKGETEFPPLCHLTVGERKRKPLPDRMLVAVAMWFLARKFAIFKETNGDCKKSRQKFAKSMNTALNTQLERSLKVGDKATANGNYHTLACCGVLSSRDLQRMTRDVFAAVKEDLGFKSSTSRWMERFAKLYEARYLDWVANIERDFRLFDTGMRQADECALENATPEELADRVSESIQVDSSDDSASIPVQSPTFREHSRSEVDATVPTPNGLRIGASDETLSRSPPTDVMCWTQTFSW